MWMWELDCKESWAPKNYAFELWCWRRLLRVPWTARRSNPSILKEINLEYLLEGLMLNLKLQCLGHLMRRTDSLEKRPWCWERLKAGGEGDNRGWDCWMASPTQWIWVGASSGGVGDGQGSLVCCSPWARKESDMTEWLNWTELNWLTCSGNFPYTWWKPSPREVSVQSLFCIHCYLGSLSINMLWDMLCEELDTLCIGEWGKEA